MGICLKRGVPNVKMKIIDDICTQSRILIQCSNGIAKTVEIPVSVENGVRQGNSLSQLLLTYY